MPLVPRVIYAALMWKEHRRARRCGPNTAEEGASSQATGHTGEILAYWFLRRVGYTVVSRNLRQRPAPGELDLVGWDGAVLAFVEVKTRTSAAAGPPESAVMRRQQQRIARAAAIYVRRLKRKEINYRFDVVSVAWKPREGYEIKLIKDAFKG
ncbi:MAG: YraN family protein [Terriglobia bacterium]